MKYINIPGINNSGPEHWQTKWEELFPDEFIRVEQYNWSNPDKNSWLDQLNKTIARQQDEVILVAHSLGCITTLQWADQFNAPNVAGALLVAPADVERAGSERLKGFAPVPCKPLPFATVVVASGNDPYADINKAALWANTWEAEFIDIGNQGHINAESQLGNWDQGLEILHYLRKSIFK